MTVYNYILIGVFVFKLGAEARGTFEKIDKMTASEITGKALAILIMYGGLIFLSIKA